MKKLIRNFGTATLLGIALITSNTTLRAQSSESSTTSVSTTTSAGTISEFSPNSIVIRSESSPEPLSYSYTKTTTYVDEDGAPVSLETVKSGLPVTVYYTKSGDRMVASKVIVRKHMRTESSAPAIEEKKTSTTTTTTDK